MSVRPGLGPGAARVLGERPRPTAIICDSCGSVRQISGGSGGLPAWFFAGHAAPGWKLEQGADGLRRDRCPRCKESAPVAGEIDKGERR